MPKKMDKLDKRGVDLTLNTIIIAVLVILVLVVVVVFFLGGFQGLTSKIRNTFFSATAGTDKVFAVQTCSQFCEQAKLLPKNLQPSSSYCSYAFAIEGESIKDSTSGIYDRLFVCGPLSRGDRNKFNTNKFESLGISCPEINCGIE